MKILINAYACSLLVWEVILVWHERGEQSRQ